MTLFFWDRYILSIKILEFSNKLKYIYIARLYIGCVRIKMRCIHNMTQYPFNFGLITLKDPL